MADDNRFAGISEQLGEGSDDEDAETSDSDALTSESEDVAEGEVGDAAEEKTGDAAEEEAEVEKNTDGAEESNEVEKSAETEETDEGGPAFDFGTTAQTSIYPRTETARDTLDDVEFEVEGVLRREHDVRDLAGRELHDAMIRLAAERPEEVADLVVQLRDDE
ncbi:hypothetical protein [Halorussus ruber]|uniref:hypothetical protein n=1 Tax=Halorussus ruber TaxID=1126238 RepID=UPI001092462C|nr:hypothetical protein [Halorussus ruber]